MLTAPNVGDLADFAGTVAAEYSTFATTALEQATLLFEDATGLEEYPDNARKRQIAYNGICEMAQKIYDSQEYASVVNTPFQSETIGSYSYSKASQAVSAGQPTGVLWFDLAVSRMSVRTLVEGSSRELFEEFPGSWPSDPKFTERPFG